MLPLFAEYGGHDPCIQVVVVIALRRALDLSSRAHDDGASEVELQWAWTNRFPAIQPGGRSTT